ncbi:MAG: YybH family protein [Candidatus Hodarchaeales archaeon]|jgi:ketosteroid isomerase-like protein
MPEIQSPEEFMNLYEKEANSLDFNRVGSFIANDATYWFTDGSFTGINEIRSAFERTWKVIENEKYAINNVKWLTKEESHAVCIYSFKTEGIVNGEKFSAMGRGTNVLKKIDGKWKIIHEHLSINPNDSKE